MSSELSPGKKPPNLIKTGLLVLITSPILAILPYLAGALLSVLFCGPDANEGNCAWAALPWFMFLTIPAAVVMFFVGIIMMLIGVVKGTKRKIYPHDGSE
jgi:hypothetical protein